jgi:choline dehydrogenase-like flavoprotein
MIIDAQLAQQESYDLCILGAGPAGIIVALEYEKLQPGKRILLIEYGAGGGALRNRLDDSIRIVDTANHHSPYECTNKGLGGSTASWGGRCVMYDEADFMQREILDGQCTWDISLLRECRKHANRTAEYFECGDGTFNLNEIPAFAGSRIAENFRSGDVTDSVIERWSMPTRFGQRYGPRLSASRNIHLLTGWEAFSFTASPDDGTIASIDIRNCARGLRAKVNARVIVIAAGAQETTRLLLRNKQVFEQRGGAPCSLGKYYQGHVSGKIAGVRFYGDPKRTDYGFMRTPDGVYLRRRFQLSTGALIENNLLNTALWLDNPRYANPQHRNGAMSFMYLAMITPYLGRKLAPPAIARSITQGKVNKVPQHILNVLKDLPKSLAIPAAIFYSRYCIKRKLPGVFLYSGRNAYALHFHSEQVPVPGNRMELAPDGETLNIYYTLADRDVDSVIRTHDFLDKWLRKCNCGELEYWYPKEELPAAIRSMSIDGLHQAGTTRIGRSDGDGVVDRDLRVFGCPNLYVCSSSVFPTSGQANPTFLLGAFAVRLANHLSSGALRAKRPERLACSA